MFTNWPVNDYRSYIKHYGVPNQKWGVRRYQNYDGSLTPLGRERYGYVSNADVLSARNEIVKNSKRDLEKAYARRGALVEEIYDNKYNINDLENKKAKLKSKLSVERDRDRNRKSFMKDFGVNEFEAYLVFGPSLTKKLESKLEKTNKFLQTAKEVEKYTLEEHVNNNKHIENIIKALKEDDFNFRGVGAFGKVKIEDNLNLSKQVGEVSNVLTKATFDGDIDDYNYKALTVKLESKLLDEYKGRKDTPSYARALSKRIIQNQLDELKAAEKNLKKSSIVKQDDNIKIVSLDPKVKEVIPNSTLKILNNKTDYRTNIARTYINRNANEIFKLIEKDFKSSGKDVPPKSSDEYKDAFQWYVEKLMWEDPSFGDEYFE